MATKQSKKRRRIEESQPRELRERRFPAEKNRTHPAVAVVGMAGAAALGAGVWSRWFMDPAASYAMYLLVPGAAALAGALFWGDQNEPVRVGDGGIAIERNGEVLRVPWCDIQHVRREGGTLLVASEAQTLRISIGAQPQASAWILAEGARRLPDVIDIKPSAADDLPEPNENAGERLRVEDLQVAGRHCAASQEPIAFERDARLCPKCTQVYHRQHVPDRCTTCQAKLGTRALRPPA